MEKRISYQEYLKDDHEYAMEQFRRGSKDYSGDEYKTTTLKTLANVAAFANKFASNEFKDKVDNAANTTFGIYDIEHQLAEIVDQKYQGLDYDWCGFATFTDDNDDDFDLGDASIKISDDVRNVLNQKIDKYYEKYQEYKNRDWSIPAKEWSYEPLKKLYEYREAGKLFDKDGNLMAQPLVDRFFLSREVTKFIESLSGNVVYDLEDEAKKEGYDNTRLMVYHDGRIEDSHITHYVYLDNTPPDDMEKLYEISRQIEEDGYDW